MPKLHKKYSRKIGSRARSNAERPISGPQFYAVDNWYEPTNSDRIQIIPKPAGKDYVHAVTPRQIADRLEEVPERFRKRLDVVELSTMTKKRQIFSLYGMQWGTAIYLYPLEYNLIESYDRAPDPQQRIEAERFGGKWYQEENLWKLKWTPETLRDFYLNDVLIHELGHINDIRNTNFKKREAFANHFAREYGWKNAG